MLARWQRTVVDQRGNIVPGAVLQVRRESDQALVTIYRDRDGTDPYPTGHISADENGYAYFYASDGLYRIRSVSPAIDWRDVSVGQSGAPGVQRYATYEDMQNALPQPEGVQAQVYSDPTESLRGFYDLIDGQWIWADPQPANEREVARALRLGEDDPPTSGGRYLAHNNRIVDLGDAQADGDAVNRRVAVAFDNAVRHYAEELAAAVAPGAGTGAFQQFGINVVTRTFQDKERDSYDLKDFRGSTFTDKLWYALSECLGNGYGLRLPYGEHILEGDVEISVSEGAGRMAIRGHGGNATVIRCRGTGVRLNLSSHERVELADLAFVCDSPAYAGQGTALMLQWDEMTSGRGWKLDNVHFGYNSPQAIEAWMGTGLHVKGKGGGVITRCWFQGKVDVEPQGTGLILEDCKEVDILATAFYNLEVGATSNGQGLNEGIKFDHTTMVRVDTGIDMGASVGLPNFELTHSHIAYCRRGVRLTGMTQSWLTDNLIYGRNDTTRTEQTDIELLTCPSVVVSRNRFFSGLPRGPGVTKVGILIDGSCRNSEYSDNLFSQRDVGIQVTTNSQGVRDSIFSRNRAEVDLVGVSTVGKLYDIPDYDLHRRVRFVGYNPTDFSTKLSLIDDQAVPQNVWTTLALGNASGLNPDLELFPTGTPGEYNVPYIISMIAVRAVVRIVPSGGANAGFVGLRLMQNRGIGWFEVGRVSSGGTDVTLNLVISDLALEPGGRNMLKFEVYQSATGSATVSSAATSATIKAQ